jgi:uncharacterized protein
MEHQSFKGVEVDRCTGCFGLFCSPDAIEKTRETRLAEKVLDIGYESTGESYNKVGNIHCPVCSIKMDKISDPEQTHIWMEVCSQCKNVFLDAGELTDLKYVTIMDKIRDWRKGVRSSK